MGGPSVQLTVSLWWLLWLYCAISVGYGALLIYERPWQVNALHKPWWYRPPGVVIACALNTIVWPFPVAQDIRRAVKHRRRKPRPMSAFYSDWNPDD